MLLYKHGGALYNFQGLREGREKLNFSEWQRPQKVSKEAAQSVRKGEMPPWPYVLLHPEAKLIAEERSALIRGLEATVGIEASLR
jgi:hypothetical protein